MPSRQEILKRIRYSRRINYDRPPDGGKEVVPESTSEPGQGAKQQRMNWLKSRLNERKAGSGGQKMGGHEMIFHHLLRKAGEEDPGRVIMHMNNFFDQNRLHRDYNEHMRNEGFDIPGPSREWSASYVSKHALNQATGYEVLNSIAGFLDKIGKADEARKHVESRLSKETDMGTEEE